MVQISRATEASNIPILIQIATDRIPMSTFTLNGPLASVKVPGDRIIFLAISGAPYYGIVAVIDNQEYNIPEIARLNDFPRVDAILIYDGFIYGPGVGTGGCLYPGYTYRPQMVVNGTLIGSGKSFIYPGQVGPCPQYGPYGYGGYNGYDNIPGL